MFRRSILLPYVLIGIIISAIFIGGVFFMYFVVALYFLPHMYLGTKTGTIPQEYSTIQLKENNPVRPIIAMAPDDADYLLQIAQK